MRLAIHADRIFTGLGNAAEPGVVLVEDDRIAAILPSAPTDGTPVRRLTGATLLPGLIDSHTHVSIVPSRGDQLGQMRLPADIQLATARCLVLSDLLSGVTTLRVMGQELDVDFLLRGEIAAGATLGPDLICAGVQVTKDGAHGHALTAIRTEADIEALVDRNVSKGAGLVKIFTTGGVSSVATSQGECPFTPAEIRCAADAAHRHGLKLAAHAHGGIGARLALENGVDTIEHGVLFDDELIDLAEKQGKTIVGTFSILDHPAGIEAGDAAAPSIIAKLRKGRERVGRTWRTILQRRIKVAVGTDSMHGLLAFDVARLVDFGASPGDALRAATKNGAETCGLRDRGALEAGLRADLVAVRGNPLDDIHALEAPVFVMKAGRTVHAV